MKISPPSRNWLYFPSPDTPHGVMRRSNLARRGNFRVHDEGSRSTEGLAGAPAVSALYGADAVRREYGPDGPRRPGTGALERAEPGHIPAYGTVDRHRHHRV